MRVVGDTHPAVVLIYNFIMEQGWGKDPDGHGQWTLARNLAQALFSFGYLLPNEGEHVLNLDVEQALKGIFDEAGREGHSPGEEGGS